MRLTVGQWVRHNTKDWGPGRVEAVGENVAVRFPGERGGNAILFKADAPPLKLDGDQVNKDAAAVLGKPASTTSTVIPTRPRPKPVPTRKPGPSADALVERFLTLFPGGFASDKYLGEERGYKLAASRACREALAPDSLDALIAAGDRPGLVAELRRATAKIGNLLSIAPLTAQFTALITREDTVLEVATGFAALARSEDATAVAPLYDAMRAAAPKDFPWQFATLLPWLFDPEHHIYVQPEAFRYATSALGAECPPKGVAPSAEGYATLLAAAARWRERLTPLGAADMIDVQSFIHRVKPEPPKTTPAPKPKKK